MSPDDSDSTETNALDLPGMGDTPISAAHGISALALNLALKWLDMGMIKDGSLYQQKKLEGANIRLIDLPDVLATAREFEKHILGSPNRLSELVIEALGEAVDEVLNEDGDEAAPEEQPA